MTAARAKSSQLAILVPFTIVTLIWGSTWIIIRGQLGVVPPTWSVTYRFLVAGVLMLAYAATRGERLWMGRRGFAIAALLGILQFTLNFNLIYRAEEHITSGLVAVVFALLLVPNAIFGRILLGQALGRQVMVGAVIAIAGIVLLFVNEARLDPHGPEETIMGVVLTLGGMFFASCANVLQASDAMKPYAMAPMIGTAMLVGALVDAAYAWATVGPPVLDLSISYLAGLLYLAAISSAIGFGLYFGILRVIGPAKAAYSSVIIPVIAMALSTMFEGYRWSAFAAGGAVLALAGLIISFSAARPTR